MAVSEPEWASIGNLVRKIVRQRGEYFVTGKVIDRDIDRKVIFMAEFGDQPIPIIAFRQKIRYFDTQVGGSLKAKEVIAEAVVPEIGETVLVARELGTRRLPRCLGVVQSFEYVIAQD